MVPLYAVLCVTCEGENVYSSSYGPPPICFAVYGKIRPCASNALFTDIINVTGEGWNFLNVEVLEIKTMDNIKHFVTSFSWRFSLLFKLYPLLFSNMPQGTHRTGQTESK